MKKMKVIIFVLFLATLFPVSSVISQDVKFHESNKPVELNVTQRPNLHVPETEFEFEPVVDGTIIVHKFPISNKGPETLTIKKIFTGCPCATPEHPKEILPGEDGLITITIDTNGYGGADFNREIVVFTNDPVKKSFKLFIRGKVDIFVFIDPKLAILKGVAGEKIQRKISITQMEKYPFKILKTTIDEAIKDKVKFTLKEDDGRYRLLLENLVTIPEKYRGKIHFETDSKIKPRLDIAVVGKISKK